MHDFDVLIFQSSNGNSLSCTLRAELIIFAASISLEFDIFPGLIKQSKESKTKLGNTESLISMVVTVQLSILTLRALRLESECCLHLRTFTKKFMENPISQSE